VFLPIDAENRVILTNAKPTVKKTRALPYQSRYREGIPVLVKEFTS